MKTMATIYDRNGWQLISHSNGGAYTLRQFRPEGSYSVFFQYGDDADDFRREFDHYDEAGIDPRDLFGNYTEVMERD